MRQPIFTPKLPDPSPRRPVPPAGDGPAASDEESKRPLKSPLVTVDDACKTSGLSSTLLPKAALQPAMLLRKKPANAPKSIPDAPGQAAEQLPYAPAVAPSNFDAGDRDQEPEWPDDKPQQADNHWARTLPTQTGAPAPAPMQARGSAAKGSVAELEASVHSDLVRLRAKALVYWQELQPKLKGFNTGKHRRLQWAAGLAVLLLLTPVGDHAWASIADGLDQVGAETRTRAAFQYIEDFREGILAEWDGSGLSTDETGAARANDLTFYEGTMDLTDYFMDFDFALDRPSLGWVVRAGSRDSYCAFKLQQTGTKKKPRYQFVRYPVVGGQPDENQRVEVDITGDYREEGHNRISVRIRGDRVATFLNGRSVDFWTDKVFGKGGIGFWSDDGDSAQIQRVAVYGNEDFWGLTLYAALEATNRVKQFFGGPAPVDSQSQAAF